MASPDACVPVDPALDAARCDERRAAVRDQLRRLAVPDEWRIDVRLGLPAFEIIAMAREIEAGVIVLGLTHHSVLDRALGRETALHVVRSSSCPVLAAVGALEHAPRRIAVAVDFTPASVLAAQAAFAVAGDDARVQLVHVRETHDPATEVLAEWYATYQHLLDGDFALLESRIDVPPGMHMDRRAVHGHVAQKLLERVEHWDPDLVVVATHGGGFFHRLVVGSVTTELLRRATKSILVVPPIAHQQTTRMH